MGRDYFVFFRSMKSSLIDEDPQRDIALQMTRWIVEFKNNNNNVFAIAGEFLKCFWKSLNFFLIALFFHVILGVSKNKITKMQKFAPKNTVYGKNSLVFKNFMM